MGHGALKLESSRPFVKVGSLPPIQAFAALLAEKQKELDALKAGVAEQVMPGGSSLLPPSPLAVSSSEPSTTSTRYPLLS